MNVELISFTAFPLNLIRKAMGECYQRPLGVKTVQKAVEAGHLSVLEHCYASFEITVSTSVLLQLTRHRHLSFTVQSSRGCELKTYHKTGIDYIDKLIEDHMADYEYVFREAKKKEDAAYLLPKAAEYTLVVTGNFRAWYEYLPKRLCKRAQPEHQELASEIHKKLADLCPEIFDKDFMKCDMCTERSCSFS
jgi:thymidylate synthase (FAD)